MRGIGLGASDASRRLQWDPTALRTASSSACRARRHRCRARSRRFLQACGPTNKLKARLPDDGLCLRDLCSRHPVRQVIKVLEADLRERRRHSTPLVGGTQDGVGGQRVRPACCPCRCTLSGTMSRIGPARIWPNSAMLAAPQGVAPRQHCCLKPALHVPTPLAKPGLLQQPIWAST